MAFIPVENTAHILIQGHVDNQEVDNDLYFRSQTGAITQASLVTLMNAVHTWWNDNMIPLLNEAYVFGLMRARDLTTQFGFVAEAGFGPVNGGVSGEAAPNNCTMAVSFRTAFAGRAFRGRNYVPCLTNSEVNENTIDATFSANVVSAYNQLVAGNPSQPAGWVWVVVSRQFNGVPRTVGVFNEIFNVLVTDNIVDSQRRRLPGRGK